jgi:hypothetical protein
MSRDHSHAYVCNNRRTAGSGVFYVVCAEAIYQKLVAIMSQLNMVTSVKGPEKDFAGEGHMGTTILLFC